MSQYDSTRIRVTDLALGFLFDYDLQTWEVTEEYEYDWGNSFYTKEYKIDSGNETAFLSVEVDDEVEISIWRKVNVLGIDRNLPSFIMQHDEPPREVSLGGVTYARQEEALGYWRNTRSSNWQKFINWDYKDHSGQKLLSIERWDEEEFEAATGKVLREFEISNILPRDGQPKRAPRDYDERKKKSRNFMWLLLIGLVFVFFGLARCGNSQSAYHKKPVDELTQQLMPNESFSIILYDMDVNESGWSYEYLHKYLVVSSATADAEPTSTYTDWLEVSEDYFKENENNLGMELVSKKDGKINKTVSPPGWGAYVGNEQYGEWKTNERGESFWSFYGKYMFFSSIFDLATRPVYRSYYGSYYNDYYGRRSYYGPSMGGGYYYGTNSSYTKQRRPDFYTRRQQKNNFSTQRRSRSSSRYRGGSYRSRGGGFGK
ncbi:DUF4178 domain-containing protein [bacterium]|nr:DUF4178 domain-containing protein [bacterium]